MKKLFIDDAVCIGCHCCQIVCSMRHLGDENNPRKSRIRVHDDHINNVFHPVACKQCTKPACVAACPEDAIHKDPVLGTPVIDPEKCTGCLACVEACPFDAMFVDESDNRPLVCDLCGGDPECVKICPAHPTRTHAALGYTTPQEWSRIKTGKPAEKGGENAN
ncbi:MAG: 4Fe-4S dicluster domain-containing protein [Chloroflexota bacterium]